MEHKIHITLRYNMAIGKVTSNEIAYQLKEIRHPLMLQVVGHVLKTYDELIAERLNRTDIYPSTKRKGVGKHIRKNDPYDRFCRGRKVVKKGYREKPRTISTLFGDLSLPIREVEWLNCGPLLSALTIGR